MYQVDRLNQGQMKVESLPPCSGRVVRQLLIEFRDDSRDFISNIVRPAIQRQHCMKTCSPVKYTTNKGNSNLFTVKILFDVLNDLKRRYIY